MLLNYDEGCRDIVAFPTNIRVIYEQQGIELAKYLNYTAFDEKKRNIWENSNIYIQKLKTYMDEQGKLFVQEKMQNIPIHLGRAWIQIYNKNQCIDVHHHAYSILTCVFYVTVPENSGDLILVDPRGSVIQYDIYRSEAALDATSIRFKPKEGSLIFFPGYMLHYTELNVNDKKRRCIAANFFRDQHPEVKERILPDEEYSSN